MYIRIAFQILLLLVCLSMIRAQSGDGYEITQSVIANGGGGSSDSDNSLTGTIGQPIAGTISTGEEYSVSGGFWSYTLAPTAAMVSVSGRVVSADGNGISDAGLTLTDAGGTQRLIRANSWGYFRFSDIEAGQTYLITVSSRRYEFAESSRVISVVDEITGLNFVALP